MFERKMSPEFSVNSEKINKFAMQNPFYPFFLQKNHPFYPLFRQKTSFLSCFFLNIAGSPDVRSTTVVTHS